jgi:RNA polymerase sigma-70 factor (ECF subfamily)
MDEANVSHRLEQARGGSREALGQLFDVYRKYLLRIASEELDARLAAKLSPSDVVQETFLEAQRDFGQFQGGSEEEWLAWLRRLLLNNVVSATRGYHTGKRQLQRELPAQEAVLANVADSDGSPAAPLRRREQHESVGNAIRQLPEHYRNVIHWRNYERLSFADIGARLGKSAEASRQLWVRALEQLERLLEPGDAS